MAKFKMSLMRPFVRRIRYESFIKSLFVALAAGAVAAFAAMVVMWSFFKINWLILACIFAGTTLIVGLICYCIIYRIGSKDIIRRIDEAGLQERLTTMEELRDDTSYIAKLQREDTMRRIKELKPRALHLALPMIAGIVLLCMSVISAAAAFIPQPQKSVRTDAPIYDDYEIIIPAINNLPGKLYQAVEQINEKLPETLRDELNDIIKDIEDLNNGIKDGTEDGDMDNVADLENAVDRLDQLLDENVKGPLLSDFMKEYASLKPLAMALKAGTVTAVHDALYDWCLGYAEQLSRVISEIKKTDMSERMSDMLLPKLTALLVSIENTTISFHTDRALIGALVEELATNAENAIFATDSVERLLGASSLLKPLSDALLAGDGTQVQDALVTLETGLLNEGAVDKDKVDELITLLGTVMGNTTSDRPSENTEIDKAWTAVQNLHGKLEQVSILSTGESAIALERLTETFMIARAEFAEVVAVNNIDSAEYQNATAQLTAVYSGRYLFAYLWNDPTNVAYMSQMGSGIAADLRQVLDVECGFKYYKDSALVNALYELLSGLEYAAENALSNGGDYDALYDLYGATRPDGTETAHVRHIEKNIMPSTCNKIIDALTAEQEIQDVIEDMKDQIQDAIDDLLNPDEEDDKVEEPDIGIDILPPDQPSGGTPPEGSDDENSEQEQPNNPNQSPSGGSTNTGKEDLDGMKFFNPNTGEEEILTEARLEEFKAALDKAIAEGNYSAEEETQMNRYYKYLLEKFSK